MPSNLTNILEDYFKEKGLRYKTTTTGQYTMEICPACGDNKFHHCYVNRENGLWDCKKCSAKGNFNHFREYHGDSWMDLSEFVVPVGEKEEAPEKVEYVKPNPALAIDCQLRLDENNDLKEYLHKERGLNDETIQHFQIGVSAAHSKVTIPIYENGELVNIKSRRNPKDTEGPRYINEAGCKAALFNGDSIEEGEEVYLVEGEFDAMVLWQNGYKRVVSTTLGAGSFPDDWVQKLRKASVVYICYDTDEPGKEGAQAAAQAIGTDRCRIVSLPAPADTTKKKNDITDFFNEGHTALEFADIAKSAKKFKNSKPIVHISEMNEELRNALLTKDIFGEFSGYSALDHIMGGFRKGRVIILSGLTSVGKSSLAACIGLNFALNKKPVFYFSLEMPPIDLAKKFLILRSKLRNDDLLQIADPSPALTKVDATLVEFLGDENVPGSGMPIYMYNGSGMIKPDTLDKMVALAMKKIPPKLIVIDHLHYFSHNFNNMASETAMVVRRIKQLAVEHEVPILLLAHLNRGGRSQQRKGLYTPSLSDLRDSGAIEQDADQVLFVCRDSENENATERQKAFVKVAKNRDGMAGRSVSMFFDEGINFFEEVEGVDYEQEKIEEKKELDAEVKMDDIAL